MCNVFERRASERAARVVDHDDQIMLRRKSKLATYQGLLLLLGVVAP